MQIVSVMSLQILGTRGHAALNLAQMGFPPTCSAEQILSVERSSPSLVIWGICIVYKKTTLFVNDVDTRTSCYPFRWSQGQAGGVITSTGWELPAGSPGTMSWLSSSCSQGAYSAQHGLKATMDMAWRPHWMCSPAQDWPVPAEVNHDVAHSLLNKQHSPGQDQYIPPLDPCRVYFSQSYIVSCRLC